MYHGARSGADPLMPAIPRPLGRAVRAAAILLALPWPASAERLPIRAFGPGDGLPHNQVHTVVRDSRGFMWLGTSDGLARFDGQTFATFSVEQGLPHRTVTAFLETRAGELWVATLGGLTLFRPGGAPDPAADVPMFEAVLPDEGDPRARAVTRLLEGRDGTIWCGTRLGLFRLVRDGGRTRLEPVDIGIPDTFLEAQFVHALAEDAHGTLWVGTEDALYRRWPDGTAARYAQQDGLPATLIHAVHFDRGGRFWVAARGAGFFRLSITAERQAPKVIEHYTHRDGLPSDWVSEFREDSSGRFWLATSRGLVELLRPDDGRVRFRVYSRRHGLTHEAVECLGEDADGNLWLGTVTAGAMRLARHGFTTYDTRDGIVSANEIFEDSRGDLYVKASVLTAPGLDAASHRNSLEHFRARFGRLDGERFEWFEPPAPFGMGWTLENRTVRTPDGEWWIGGSGAVYRYPARASFFELRSAAPLAVFTMADGLAAPQAHRLYGDSRGNVWISLISGAYGLSRWDRATRTLVNLAGTPGLPSLTSELPRAFGEDAAGNVWVGLNSGAARFKDGRFTFFGGAAGMPDGHVRAIHRDRAGRLWIASAGSGLVRVDDPDGDRPTFVRVESATALSSSSLVGITEDQHGRLYLATARGLDRFDPASGRTRSFTVEDGLAAGEIIATYADRFGTIWVATQAGLSRLTPPPPGEAPVPRVVLTQLSIGGRAQPVSAVGATRLDLPDLPASDNQLEIGVVPLGGAPGARPRFQFRLGPNEPWSPATGERTFRLAGLSPGAYAVEIRAMSDEVESPEPAVVAFTILRPVWQRPWFAGLMMTLAAAAVVMLHRYRLARALEIERVRTRIATDLHDDIGANLTRIAILSEVARQRASDGPGLLDSPLSSIAAISRESVSSMSDIVWAVSPARDTLSEVVRRIRHHAEEVFESQDVDLTLELPAGDRLVRLGLDVRRDVYLIFKEAVNNAARHSRCSRVVVRLTVDEGVLRLTIADNGVGFDVASDVEGHGLASMRRRARALGAALDILSGAGGTTISLAVALAGRLAPTPMGR
jgi:ligand-binding sensor domain-containing protein/signal transduction histidine kinase